MSFGNVRVLSFESRRANEIAELIRLQGGDPFVAPALVELPLEANTEAYKFADRLYAGGFDMIIFLTGVGARLLRVILAQREPDTRLPDALRQLAIVVRGPKPSAVMREWQVPVAVMVPEPNTWREVLAAVEARTEKRVAVQEYGRSNPDLLEGLAAQGREVTRVPVYSWAIPEDKAPLENALDQLLTGKFSAVLFTTGVQVEHFLEFAEGQGKKQAAVDALGGLYIASIGPSTSETLRAFGLAPAMEPSHPKMGLLVREAAERYAATV